MKASQWEYLGEGGKHAIFAFRGADGNSSCANESTTEVLNCEDSLSSRYDWEGKLLRIPKSYLRLAAASVVRTVSNHQTVDDNDLVNYHPKEECHDSSSPTFYIRNIVSPSLAPFVDVPQSIRLEWTFLKELRNQTLQTTDIPSARQKDWGRLVEDEKGDDGTSKTSRFPDAPFPHFAWAMVVRDYRTPFPRPSPSPPPTSVSTSAIAGCITIEIKPKAGYLSFSPLVDPEHRVKYRQSRFVSLQRLHQLGQWTKGWTDRCSTKNYDISKRRDEDFGGGEASHFAESATTESGYDPLDFFLGSIDGDSARLQRALTQLLAQPQNNLRIWCDNQIVVGQWDHMSTRKVAKCCNQNLGNMNSGCSNHAPTTQRDPSITPTDHETHDMLSDIMFQVFSSSIGRDILSKILALQKLDVLDVDGAVLVYQRMVDRFCGGSHEQAQRLLDDIRMQDVRCRTMGTAACVPMFESSPFEYVNDEMDPVSRIALIQCCKDIQAFQAELSRVFPSLPTTAYMDQMRDKVVRGVNELSLAGCRFLLLNWLLSLAMCDVSIFATVLHRNIHDDSISQPSIDVAVGGGAKRFTFRLRLIDCDQKPAKKLQNRSSKEAVFRLLRAKGDHENQ